MLQKNHLQPPRPAADPSPPMDRATPASLSFVSAEDFDGTGILAGVDPCESRYWWMPDLYEPLHEPMGGR
jgi:hypothetical protein